MLHTHDPSLCAVPKPLHVALFELMQLVPLVPLGHAAPRHHESSQSRHAADSECFSCQAASQPLNMFGGARPVQTALEVAVQAVEVL